jgi:hypothetical protein
VPAAFLPGTLSQDVVSLLAGLAVLVTGRAIRRGSARAWLVWLGLLGYLFYAYSVYAFERVYSLQFLTYVAIVGLTLWAVILFFARADLQRLEAVTSRPLPRRSVAVYLLVLAATFAALWLSQVVPAIGAQRPPDGSTIFVLDLSFFLPLLVVEAGLLLRRRPLGDALGVPVLVLMSLIGASVLLGALLAPLFGHPFDPGGLVVYALLGLVSAGLAFWLFPGPEAPPA